MIQAFANKHYDVVYDQICFNPRHTKIAVDAFGDRINRYVVTSSMAVYGHKDTVIMEDDFSPEQYAYDLEAEDYQYDEGKLND